jgi:hypothetical protein
VKAPASLVGGPRACSPGAERGHGQRGSSRDSGGGTGEVGHEEEERKEKGCRQVGSSWRMTEKEGMTEKRTGMTERKEGMTERKEGMTESKEGMTERKEGMTDLLSCFLPFLFQPNSILFEFNSNLNSTPMHSTK